MRGALDALGAQRIEHGVRAIEDPRLVERLTSEQVCLDVCPTSNVQLRVVPSLHDHPLARLVEAGVANAARKFDRVNGRMTQTSAQQDQEQPHSF